MSALVKYLTLQYKLGKIDEAYLDNLVSIGKITEQEKEYIMGE